MRLTDASSSPRSLEPRTLTRLLRRAILPPLLLLTVLVAVLLWQVNTLVQAHRERKPSLALLDLADLDPAERLDDIEHLPRRDPAARDGIPVDLDLEHGQARELLGHDVGGVTDRDLQLARLLDELAG